MNTKNIKKSFAILGVASSLLFGCKVADDEVVNLPRLFMPVLSKDLSAKDNTIIVNMANSKAAVAYKVEVSRDTFKTVDFKLKVDTNYVVINSTLLKGDALFWNTNYQVRAQAIASDTTQNSKVSNLGIVKTDKFPSILIAPTSADLLDVMARVRWAINGTTVAKVKVFAKTDLKLATPLATYDVSAADNKAGFTIVKKLKPETNVQIAIYDASDKILGWDNFTTIKQGVDTSQPNVIDLSDSDDPNALATALPNVVEGGVIVLKKGAAYTLSTTVPFTKSVTITSAYGFGDQKTLINTTGGGLIADGSTIEYIRFNNVEIKGADIGASYVFNPDRATTTLLKELTFDNCILSNMRGLLRIRTKMFITNYNIKNSIIYSIGNYGILTADTDGAGAAAIDNITFTNSTFSKINVFLTSRQNSKTVTLESCTFNELGDVASTAAGHIFNWRGTSAALNNITGGVKIANCIFGQPWNTANATTNVAIKAKNLTSAINPLGNTTFSVSNTYGTSDFAIIAGTEIAGLPSFVYAKKATDLWVSPGTDLNFNFKDAGFAGKRDAGDPRWRVQ